ncbi:hypothetical protein Tco_1303160 [Tanacetum coccineum]
MDTHLPPPPLPFPAIKLPTWQSHIPQDQIRRPRLILKIEGSRLELLTLSHNKHTCLEAKEPLGQDGPRYGLHLNVDKTELFWPKEDPRSRLEGIFPHNISRPLHGVKLLGGPVSVDVDFGSALVMKRVSKTIGLLDAVAKINDPQCELLLIRACAGVSKLYFTMRTCPLCLCMALFVLPWTLLSRGFSDRGDVLNYAFIASRLQSATLQTKLLRDVGIVAHGSTSSDA